MRQAIHIFRKDVRHCWPYIATVLGATALQVWQESPVAVPVAYPEAATLNVLAPVVAVTWWLAIAATVHGESLVGDRQFWITRPYSWKCLLAAKVLFVAAFIGAPLLIADCVILLANGFRPLDYSSGLLLRQCWLAAFLASPFALASLTRTTRAFVVAAVAISFLSVRQLFFALPIPASPSVEEILIAVLATWLSPALAMALAVVQFMERRTVRNRFLWGVLGVLLTFTLPSVLLLAPRGTSVHANRQRNPVVLRNATAVYQPSGYGAAGVWHEASVRVSPDFACQSSELRTCEPVEIAMAPSQSNQTDMSSPSRENGGQRRVVNTDGSFSFPIDSPDVLSQAKIDVLVNFLVRDYSYLARSVLPDRSGWARIPGVGTVRMTDSGGEFVLFLRTAISPSDDESRWAIEIRSVAAERLTTQFRPDLFYVNPGPFWFAMSPIWSHCSYAAMDATLEAAPHNLGVGVIEVVRRPGQPPLFTAKRLISSVAYAVHVRNIAMPEAELYRR